MNALVPVKSFKAVKGGFFARYKAKQALKLKLTVTQELHVLHESLLDMPLGLSKGEQVTYCLVKVCGEAIILTVKGDKGAYVHYHWEGMCMAERLLVTYHMSKCDREIKVDQYRTFDFAMFYENDETNVILQSA